MSRLGRFLCRHGHHDWRVPSPGMGGDFPVKPGLSDGRAFRRVGESVRCRRNCGAVAVAEPGGWKIKRQPVKRQPAS